MQNKDKTHCKKGHLLSGENLIVTSLGGRQCKVCKKEGDKNYRERRPEVTRASQSKYYEANKDEVKARAKKWNSDHPEKIKEKNSKYKKNFPEKDRALQAKRRAQKTQAGGSYTSAEWFTLCFACGFRCLCCGEVKPLEADHVVPVCHGGSSFLHNIQPLCGECNRHKSKKYTDYRLKEGKDSWQMKWEYWIL